LSDFCEILFAEAERHADKGHMTKTANFQNPRWLMAAILKIVMSPNISKKLSDFNEIWYSTSDIQIFPPTGRTGSSSRCTKAKAL